MITCTTTKADHGCQKIIKDFRIENAHIYSNVLVARRDGWGKHLVEHMSKKEAEKLAEKGAENDRPPLFEVKVACNDSDV
ncbi:hypothetical protein N0V85_003402 [Neurospora sp. IMI 360204]|nr:hypothetical protein N0V85_003402 [Neurospora sp. IMI 360204]